MPLEPTANRLATSLLLSFLALAPLGCRMEQAPRGVIFILLDAARADRFSSYGYERQTTPNVDALASRGIVFERTFAQATATRRSLPRLLYSRFLTPPIFPASPRVPVAGPAELFQAFDDQAVSLPRALSAAGFHTVAISAHAWLRPGTQFATQFDQLFEPSSTPELTVSAAHGYPDARQVTDFTLEQLESLYGRDYFLYLHFMDTHFPHTFGHDAARFVSPAAAEAARARFTNSGYPRNRREVLSGAAREYMDALYDGDLAFVDRQLGRLFDALRAREVLDDTLIVITSDHGENLLELRDRFDHGGPWYDAVAHIPFVLFYPRNIEPARYAGLTEGVDIVPTVLSALQIQLPEGKQADGEDLLRTVDEDQPAQDVAFSEYGLRTENYKLISAGSVVPRLRSRLREGRPSGRNARKGELYDLSSDPAEADDLWQQRPAVADRLLERLELELRPHARRFLASRTTEQPDGGFAIAAKDFTLAAGSPADTKSSSYRGTWRRSRHWSHSYLAGLPDAEPVHVSFPLPNGRYVLSAALRGSCRITSSDATAELTHRGLGSWPGSGPPPSAELVVFGAVELTRQRFTAQIEPTGQSGGCLIRYLGFEPLKGAPSPDTPDREATDRRLEALGYID